MSKIVYVYVGIGGFLGSCLRYLLTVACKNAGIIFPLGTLLSNVIAGLLIGFIIGLDRQTSLIPVHLRLFLTTGLMGGLSTFSTFSIETVDLFSSGNSLIGALNIVLNLSLSLLGVVVGMAIAKAIFRQS